MSKFYDQSYAATLLAENKELLAQMEIAERDNYEIAEYLRQELESRDQRLDELQAKVEEVSYSTYTVPECSVLMSSAFLS
jgi:uncharacterized protein HemX